jgi:PmbA protein
MKNDEINRIADKIRNLAKEYNTEGYEVFVSETKKLSLSVNDTGGIEKLQADEETGIAIRTLKDQRMGFSFNFNMSELAVEETFKRALDSGMVLDKQEFSFAGNKPDGIPSEQFYDTHVETIPESQKLEMLRKMADAARIDKRIIKVERPSYEEVVGSIAILNSEGVSKKSRTTRFSISLSALAREGEESQMSWDFQGANTFSHLAPERVARSCSQQALQTLGGIQLMTGFYDTMLTQLVASQFLSVLAGSFKADAVYKHTSMLADKLHRQVFPEHISIFDDPGLSDGFGSVPFDAEGVPAFKKAVVEKGAVNSFLYDRHYAMLMKEETTGNAVRHSITQPPATGITNFALISERASEKDLKHTFSDGPVITELMGLHTVNPVTGEFSLGARGYMIKSGEFSSPCKGITVSGNLFDLFNNIYLTGKDHMLYGNILTPSLVIKALKISGAAG